ncbi:hypothetical protein AVL59_32770 [Streptomyces griseochromogenes]|uniref:Uncharacterized protein n=1 Tax=Streptomyces griseochromogenes TaxID=68214 RepID=A0A1B1B4G5_9ACTN|nr:hypothetical protein AVL59_32770 [Streptomyces griseochromogenes]
MAVEQGQPECEQVCAVVASGPACADAASVTVGIGLVALEQGCRLVRGGSVIAAELLVLLACPVPEVASRR